MSRQQPPDPLAKLVGTLVIVALGAYVSRRLKLPPVLGAVTSYVLIAALKPEAIVVASDLGL